MGKGQKLKFHVFEIKNVTTLILCEPMPREYVWMYLYIENPYRNGLVSTEITEYVLFYLQGKHNIHWLPYLKSFQKLANKFRWKIKEKSEILDGCRCSQTRNIKYQPKSFLNIGHNVDHRVTFRLPSTVGFYDANEQRKILLRIKEIYR